MSSKNELLFNKKFNTYIEAVEEVLKNRNLQQKWLVEKIIDDEKFSSLQQQLSRWINKKSRVSERYQRRINNVLDINVNQNSEGFWIIHSQTDSGSSESDILLRLAIDDIEGEPDLDDLPQLIRLRDRIQDKIDKIVSPKKNRN